jgi:phosphohistidine phosphatase
MEEYMSLFLVRHGISQSPDKDPDPGLTKEGIADVERIASVAKGYNVYVPAIVHSEKKRAKQTAEILAAVLQPEKGVTQREGLKPMDDVAAFSRHIKREENLMVVGHLPFLEKLTAYLITGSIEPSVFQFQNGGIICLDININTGNWIIKWALMPKIS